MNIQSQIIEITPLLIALLGFLLGIGSSSILQRTSKALEMRQRILEKMSSTVESILRLEHVAFALAGGTELISQDDFNNLTIQRNIAGPTLIGQLQSNVVGSDAFKESGENFISAIMEFEAAYHNNAPVDELKPHVVAFDKAAVEFQTSISSQLLTGLPRLLIGMPHRIHQVDYSSRIPDKARRT